MPITEDVRSLLLRPAQPLPEATWNARHRALLAFGGVQLVVNLVWSEDKGVVGVHWLLHLIPLAFLLVAARPGSDRGGRSVAMALALTTLSGLFVHLADGSPLWHAHWLLSVGLLALYRDPRPLLAAAVFVVVHNIAAVTVMAPGDVYDTNIPAAEQALRAAAHAVAVVGAAGVLLLLVRARRTTSA